MSESSSSYAGGIGTPGLLGLIFIVLKLCGVIHWSWWWVLSPFWIGFALFLIGLLVIFIIESYK